MNTGSSRTLAIVVSSLLLGAGYMRAAGAAERGFYVGGFVGQSTKEADVAAFNDFRDAVHEVFGFTAGQNSATLDDKDMAYGFEVGYRLTPHLAFEGGYRNLGVLAYRDASSGEFADGASTLNMNVDSETSGIVVSALGILPLSYRMELYGRIGALFATNNFKVFLQNGEGSTARDEFSESSTDYLAGIGVSMMFLEIYNARLEFQRIFDAGDEATAEGDLDVISLGVTVGF